LGIAFAVLVLPILFHAAPSGQRNAGDPEERRKGFHCLSSWDGSNRSMVEQVKAMLREPSSFEHVETRIVPEENGKHTVIMRYRARNGFGGANISVATGTVDHETCKATLISGD